MANKRERQATIRTMIAERTVGSQEELRRLLRQRGWDVTQSTLSRDMQELRLARVATGDGARYALADARAEAGQPALAALMPTLFLDVDGVGELLVLRTHRGGAQPVAEAIDNEEWSDLLGTVAGDDTILLICRSRQARERVARRLRDLAGQGAGRATGR